MSVTFSNPCIIQFYSCLDKIHEMSKIDTKQCDTKEGNIKKTVKMFRADPILRQFKSMPVSKSHPRETDHLKYWAMMGKAYYPHIFFHCLAIIFNMNSRVPTHKPKETILCRKVIHTYNFTGVNLFRYFPHPHPESLIAINRVAETIFQISIHKCSELVYTDLSHLIKPSKSPAMKARSVETAKSPEDCIKMVKKFCKNIEEEEREYQGYFKGLMGIPITSKLQNLALSYLYFQQPTSFFHLQLS